MDGKTQLRTCLVSTFLARIHQQKASAFFWNYNLTQTDEFLAKYFLNDASEKAQLVVASDSP